MVNEAQDKKVSSKPTYFCLVLCVVLFFFLFLNLLCRIHYFMASRQSVPPRFHRTALLVGPTSSEPSLMCAAATSIFTRSPRNTATSQDSYHRNRMDEILARISSIYKPRGYTNLLETPTPSTPASYGWWFLPPRITHHKNPWFKKASRNRESFTSLDNFQ